MIGYILLTIGTIGMGVFAISLFLTVSKSKKWKK